LRTYEAIFILDQRKFEDAGESFSQDVAKQIESLGGRVEKRVGLGRRQFARPVKKQQAGVYWDFIFGLDPGQVSALVDKYRLDERVFRTEVFLYQPPPKKKRPAR
jgi:ribosomal protein S6